jgi:hypothetical protein
MYHSFFLHLQWFLILSCNQNNVSLFLGGINGTDSPFLDCKMNGLMWQEWYAVSIVSRAHLTTIIRKVPIIFQAFTFTQVHESIGCDPRAGILCGTECIFCDANLGFVLDTSECVCSCPLGIMFLQFLPSSSKLFC